MRPSPDQPRDENAEMFSSLGLLAVLMRALPIAEAVFHGGGAAHREVGVVLMAVVAGRENDEKVLVRPHVVVDV